MNKKVVKYNLNILWFVALVISMFEPANAYNIDNRQPMELRANSADINQGKGLGTYIGNVEFDQGNTHIRAHKAITKTDKHNKLIEAIIYGDNYKQAHYWSQISKDKPTVHAYANSIKYSPQTDVIELIGNAKVEQGENIFTAPQITYNIEKQHVISSKSATDNQRTVIIFHPQRKKS